METNRLTLRARMRLKFLYSIYMDTERYVIVPKLTRRRASNSLDNGNMEIERVDIYSLSAGFRLHSIPFK